MENVKKPMSGIIYSKNKAELFGKIRKKCYVNRNNRSRLAVAHKRHLRSYF